MKKRNILFSVAFLAIVSAGLSACNTSGTFTVVWKNDDGTILEVDTDVSYGTSPTYDGKTPLKASSDLYIYTFRGWSPEIAPVKANITYTAQFTSANNQHLITFKNYDGTILQSSNWAYGSTPIYSGAAPIKMNNYQYAYTFDGWSPVVVPVVGNATYTAEFTSSLHSITIGVGSDVTAILSVGAVVGTGVLVPVGQATGTQVEFVILTYLVIWEEDSTTLAPGHKGTLVAVLDPTSIEINLDDTYADLVNIEIQVGGTAPSTAGILDTPNPDILLDGAAVVVYIKVTMDEPATQTEYEAVAGFAITFSVNFSVLPS